MEYIYIKTNKHTFLTKVIITLICILITFLSIYYTFSTYSSNAKVLIKHFIIPLYISEFVFVLFLSIFLTFITSILIFDIFRSLNPANKVDKVNKEPFLIITNEGLKFENYKFIKWSDIKTISLPKSTSQKPGGIYLKDPYDFFSDKKLITKINCVTLNDLFNTPHIALLDLKYIKDDQSISLKEIISLIDKYKDSNQI